MTTYTLLCGGYRTSIAQLTFDGKTLKEVGSSPTPNHPSWVARSVTSPEVFFSLSEEEGGSAVSLRMDKEGRLEVTGQVPTQGAPCHVHPLADGTGLIISNYIGGSVLYIPLTPQGTLGKPATPLPLPFAYADGPAPIPERQDAPHAHGTVEANGLLYVADLGGDRVWIVRRSEGAEDGSGLEIVDWYQCERGWGPRHCQVSHDGKSLWVLGETAHALTSFPIPGGQNTPPRPNTTVSILPTSLPAEYTKYMDSAEVILHPHHDTLYASNRLELSASRMNPALPPLQHEKGDSIAIVMLKKDGEVEEVRQVRTGCEDVRGMQVSPDGRYVAVAGMSNGVVEVYGVAGGRGEVWELVARVGVEKVTDFVWL